MYALLLGLDWMMVKSFDVCSGVRIEWIYIGVFS
jgi:hypothetical protein